MAVTIELICLAVFGLSVVAGGFRAAFFITRFALALLQPSEPGDFDQSVSTPISGEADWPRLGDDDFLQAA